MDAEKTRPLIEAARTYYERGSVLVPYGYVSIAHVGKALADALESAQAEIAALTAERDRLRIAVEGLLEIVRYAEPGSVGEADTNRRIDFARDCLADPVCCTCGEAAIERLGKDGWQWWHAGSPDPRGEAYAPADGPGESGRCIRAAHEMPKDAR